MIPEETTHNSIKEGPPFNCHVANCASNWLECTNIVERRVRRMVLLRHLVSLPKWALVGVVCEAAHNLEGIRTISIHVAKSLYSKSWPRRVRSIGAMIGPACNTRF